jgi:hypothetical protein
MSKRLLSLAVAGSMLLGLASMASATIPDPNLSSAVAAGSGTILAVPSGAGDSIGSIGATITVTVLDASGAAIAGFPFQDIYVDDIGNGDLSLCQGGSTADANTNASGVTTISGTIGGGGFTQAGLGVYLSGVAINGTSISIDVNSCDTSGDLKVDLVDLGDFASDFTGGVYNFRSDFDFNAALDLADVGRFAQFFGDLCP